MRHPAFVLLLALLLLEGLALLVPVPGLAAFAREHLAWAPRIARLSECEPRLVPVLAQHFALLLASVPLKTALLWWGSGQPGAVGARAAFGWRAALLAPLGLVPAYVLFVLHDPLAPSLKFAAQRQLAMFCAEPSLGLALVSYALSLVAAACLLPVIWLTVATLHRLRRGG